MTRTEAAQAILTALYDAGVDYNPHQQGGRIDRLAGLDNVASVQVVRGGYRGTTTIRRVVLGCTNSRRHGKRVYTVVANLT
jgi:hypothetical protein